MNTISLKVESSTKTKNDNHLNKLVGKGATIQTEFGPVTGSPRTFYLFTDSANEKGMEAELNLDLFDIVQREYKFKDEDSGEEVVASLNYLYPKR